MSPNRPKHVFARSSPPLSYSHMNTGSYLKKPFSCLCAAYMMHICYEVLRGRHPFSHTMYLFVKAPGLSLSFSLSHTHTHNLGFTDARLQLLVKKNGSKLKRVFENNVTLFTEAGHRVLTPRVAQCCRCMSVPPRNAATVSLFIGL